MTKTALLLSLTACAVLAAADTQLRLGPAEMVGGLELASAQVEHSAVRVDEAVAKPYFRGRFADFGIELDAHIVLDEDEGWSRVDAGEISQFRLRLDYLYEIEGLLQVIPFYENNTYIGIDAIQDDAANWLGADLWYLTPLEGLEVGGTLAGDLSNDHGAYLSLGLRQFYQQAPLDLRTWQVMTFGTEDYHRYTSGTDQSGITALEFGGEATLPLPWEGAWATMRTELHLWVQDEDQDAVRDEIEFVFAIGCQFRS